jgi:glycosyltransferase involved in cell wall biosynthesis
MVRVLQLIDSDADFQAQTAASQLSRALGEGFTIEAQQTSPSLAAVPANVLRLRRRSSGAGELIHAFGPRSLLAAVFTGSRIIYTPSGFPSRRQIGWLRAAANYRELHVVCPTDTLRRSLVERGVPIERCHLIRPGVDFGRVKRRRDDGLRARLGFGPDDYIVLAPGESNRSTAQELAAWSVSILHVLDPTYKLLAWGRGRALDRATRFSDKVRLGAFASFAEPRLGREVAFEELLPATDAVLVTAQEPIPTLPISICMAAGLPIVATVSTTIAELLEDRHTALLTRDAQPRTIAQRLMDLRSDPGLQWQIADMARTEAYEYASLTRFLNQFRALYQQVARGERIEIPQQVPGAGLRFHGRA